MNENPPSIEEDDDGPVFPKDEAVKVVTTESIGMRLPIGTGPIDGSGSRDQTLTFRDWTAADERKVSAWRARHPDLNTASLVIGVLAYFVERWGSHDFTEMKESERSLVLMDANTADIFHAWMMLRIDNVSQKYAVQVGCASCRKNIDIDIDLGATDMTVPKDESATLLRDFDAFKKGFNYGGERKKKVTIAPTRWKTYVDFHKTARTDMQIMKLTLIAGAVVALDGKPMVLGQGTVDTLCKADVESLSSFIQERQYGPDLSISINCPHCDQRQTRSVIWEYDVFFSGMTSSI